MRWTRNEKTVLYKILRSLKIGDLGVSKIDLTTGIHSKPIDKQAEKILVITDLVDRLTCQPIETADPRNEQIDLKSLESFAHYIGVDRSEEFWELKCLVVALFEHPYFGEEDKRVRQSRKMAIADADLHEWWIEANWLRATLEYDRNKTLSDEELAAAMALRSRGWGDADALGMAEYDTFLEVQEHYRLELARKRKEIESLYIRQNFGKPSMRAHARKNTPGQRSTAQAKWELSEMEKDRPECLPIYQRLRQELVERARKRASRLR